MNFKWEQRETALTLEMTGTSWHNESCTGNMINRGGQRESCARARSRVVLAHELFGLILVRVSFYSFSTQTHAQMRSHTLNTPTHRTTHTPAAAALRPHHARTHAQTRTHTQSTIHLQRQVHRARTHLHAHLLAHMLVHAHSNTLTHTCLRWHFRRRNRGPAAAAPAADADAAAVLVAQTFLRLSVLS